MNNMILRLKADNAKLTLDLKEKNDEFLEASHEANWADSYHKWLHDLCDVILPNDDSESEERIKLSVKEVSRLQADNAKLRAALQDAANFLDYAPKDRALAALAETAP